MRTFFVGHTVQKARVYSLVPNLNLWHYIHYRRMLRMATCFAYAQPYSLDGALLRTYPEILRGYTLQLVILLPSTYIWQKSFLVDDTGL